GKSGDSFVIPTTVTVIGDYAFADCHSLTSVTIPNSVTTIGDGAFAGCISLTSVTIPNSVTTIGEWAFLYCESLTSVTIPNSVTNIGWCAFQDCSSLTSVTIPNSVTTIGESAFYRCYSLTSVTIPNSVTTIGAIAFEHCESLTSLTISNSVTTIGERAFGYCWNLNDVYVSWTSPLSIPGDVFYNVNVASVTLHVPSGTEAAYQSAPVWQDFLISGTPNGNALVEAATKVWYYGGVLSVRTPASEQITVYSPSGAPVFRAEKAAGEARYRLNSLPKGVYIVQGNSGWVRKIVVRQE
ncbi:MAG: leucine-rich repeat domain-containing protein, partial [Tannerella sp.]|nr:leucine-rich repeat domain-containing protein [Tannerella sp.]